MSLEIFSFSMPVTLAPIYTVQATSTPQKYPYPSISSPEDNRTTYNMVSLLKANCQLVTQIDNCLELIEATLIAGQTAYQNYIA
jgi:hypothetical protein